MSKTVVEPERPQMTIRLMRVARWITKATNTPKICNTYCFSTATMVTRTRLTITFHYYVYYYVTLPVCYEHEVGRSNLRSGYQQNKHNANIRFPVCELKTQTPREISHTSYGITKRHLSRINTNYRPNVNKTLQTVYCALTSPTTTVFLSQCCPTATNWGVCLAKLSTWRTMCSRPAFYRYCTACAPSLPCHHKRRNNCLTSRSITPLLTLKYKAWLLNNETVREPRNLDRSPSKQVLYTVLDWRESTLTA